MRKILAAAAAMAALAVSAEAGLVCVTPGELKVLQSAALQQQLMVAALTCHFSDDYNRFVTSYRGKLIRSDTELKAFFAGRARGEDYNSYKTRIANTVSLRSLHDPRFCDSAQRVFDMALGRGGERRGLVPEPPQLIDTGYEGCRAVEDKVIEARAPEPQRTQPHKAEVKVAAVAPKPAPVPVPRPASPLVRLAVVPLPKPKIAPAPRPAPMRMAETVPPPVPEIAAAPKAAPHAVVPAPQPLPPPQKLAEVRPAAKLPDRPPTAEPQRLALAAPRPVERAVRPEDDYDAAPPDDAADGDWDEPAPQTAPRYTPPQRTAALARPEWRYPAPNSYRDSARDDDDDWAGSGDRVPNAYRPGSEWVTDPDSGWRRPPPPAWRAASYAPPRAAWQGGGYYPPPRWHRRPPPGARLVLAPDGRWVVVIGHQPRWARD